MLKKFFRFLFTLVIILVLAALIVPFLIPVPALTGTRSMEELADADSHFIDVNGLNVHYKVAGSGKPFFILLHGFASSTYTWRNVMNSLSSYGSVVAFDRPAFGLTARPLTWSGQNPYTPEAQTDILVGLMDKLGIDQAILVGNSAGGTIAAYTAIRYPQRVLELVLVDASVYTSGGISNWLKPLMKTPQMRHLGPLISRNLLDRGDELILEAWHDPTKVTPDVLEEYKKFTAVENWDKALWEFTLASHDIKLGDRLDEIAQPVLVITGDDDRIVPTQDSIRLAKELPLSRLVVIPDCGHVPQEECPKPVLDAITAFLEMPVQY